MPNTSGAGSTICPFYVRETGTSIYCEGICEADEADVSTRLSFPTAEEKREWQEGHCFCYDAQCPVADSLYDKYR